MKSSSHFTLCVLLLTPLLSSVLTFAQRTAATAKPASASTQADLNQPVILRDITATTGIQFSHLPSADKRYIVESMSGGVALVDFDRDGWPDIFFTNAPDVEMFLAGTKAKSALYHNNHDGTFTDVTDKAGVGYPCWAMGAVVGDYNNDGWPDLLVSCFGGVVLYRNNGDGTFTNVTKSSHLNSDKVGRWVQRSETITATVM